MHLVQRWFFLTILLMLNVAHADVSGLIDLRAIAADDTQAWPYEGLGKQRFDRDHDGLKLGQAVIEIRSSLTDTLTSKLVFNGYDERNHFADITEAYVQWKPLPIEGYRFKAKVGAFFPTLSLENGGIGWTNPWMISTSAINTWVGEELRTIGTELSFGRLGQLHDSAHDVEFIYSIFTANDPAGSLLAWRGWSVGDRVTGLTEKLPFPEMPGIYGPTGMFQSQNNSEKPFYEIDHHYGYYVGANYGYNNWITLRALHYDNHGDPFGVNKGQWGWLTSFDHLALKIDFENNISLLTQAMQGSTRWGNDSYGVYADYDSWYVTLSKVFGKNRISTRYDHFNISNEDKMAVDNNSETGHSIAISWQYSLTEKGQTGIEYLKILSRRPGREYLGYAYNEAAAEVPLAEMPVTETSVQIFYRYKF